ncbi:hypothetical protein MDAP_000751 [Mitosporidium daphniae]
MPLGRRPMLQLLYPRARMLRATINRALVSARKDGSEIYPMIGMLILFASWSAYYYSSRNFSLKEIDTPQRSMSTELVTLLGDWVSLYSKSFSNIDKSIEDYSVILLEETQIAEDTACSSSLAEEWLDPDRSYPAQLAKLEGEKKDIFRTQAFFIFYEKELSRIAKVLSILEDDLSAVSTITESLVILETSLPFLSPPVIPVQFYSAGIFNAEISALVSYHTTLDLVYQEKLNAIIEKAKSHEIRSWIVYKAIKDHEKSIFSIETSDKWNRMGSSFELLSKWKLLPFAATASPQPNVLPSLDIDAPFTRHLPIDSVLCSFVERLISVIFDSSRLRVRLAYDQGASSTLRLLISREEIIVPLKEDDNKELFGWNSDFFLEKLSNISLVIKFISEQILVHPHLKSILVPIICSSTKSVSGKPSHSFLEALRRYILHDTVPMSPSQMAALQPGGSLWKAVQKVEDELVESFDLAHCEVSLGPGFITGSLQLIRNRYSVLLASEVRYKSLYLMNHPDNRLVSWENPPGVTLPPKYVAMLTSNAVVNDLAQDAHSLHRDSDHENESLEYAITNLLFDGKKFHLKVLQLLKFMLFLISFADRLPEAFPFDIEKVFFEIFDSYVKNFSPSTGAILVELIPKLLAMKKCPNPQSIDKYSRIVLMAAELRRIADETIHIQLQNQKSFIGSKLENRQVFRIIAKGSYRRFAGQIFSYILGTISKMEFGLEAISREDAFQLYSLNQFIITWSESLSILDSLNETTTFRSFSELAMLFSAGDRELIGARKIEKILLYIPNWISFIHLTNIFCWKLEEIVEFSMSACNSVHAKDLVVPPKVILSLVKAIFADSDVRREAIHVLSKCV